MLTIDDIAFQHRAPEAERGFICGTTGSGKTTAARELLRNKPYVVIHDGKGTIDWPEYHRVGTLAELRAAKEAKLIYTPVHHELIDFQIVESFFAWIYARRYTTLYVDEVSTVCQRDDIPVAYHACITRGRQLGIAVLSGTQRPKSLPQVIMSEAEHFYIFRLQLPQDRMKVEEITGIPRREIGRLPKHDFIYARNDGTIEGPCRINLNNSL